MTGREIVRKHKAGQRNFSKVKLRRADLEGADLRDANLSNADLRWTNLYDTDVTSAQLAQAKSLRGTTLPDGGRHE